MYVIIGSHFCAAWRLVFAYSISYCKDNIKCDSASNAPKCLFHGYHNHFIVSCANFIMTKVCIICLNVFCYFFQTFSPHMGSLKSHTKRPLYRNQDESFTMNNDNTFFKHFNNVISNCCENVCRRVWKFFRLKMASNLTYIHPLVYLKSK
jgi:hypothetical protein